jgi:hypothetical protein
LPTPSWLCSEADFDSSYFSSEKKEEKDLTTKTPSHEAKVRRYKIFLLGVPGVLVLKILPSPAFLPWRLCVKIFYDSES